MPKKKDFETLKKKRINKFNKKQGTESAPAYGTPTIYQMPNEDYYYDNLPILETPEPTPAPTRNTKATAQITDEQRVIFPRDTYYGSGFFISRKTGDILNRRKDEL